MDTPRYERGSHLDHSGEPLRALPLPSESVLWRVLEKELRATGLTPVIASYLAHAGFGRIDVIAGRRPPVQSPLKVPETPHDLTPPPFSLVRSIQ